MYDATALTSGHFTTLFGKVMWTNWAFVHSLCTRPSAHLPGQGDVNVFSSTQGTTTSLPGQITSSPEFMTTRTERTNNTCYDKTIIQKEPKPKTREKQRQACLKPFHAALIGHTGSSAESESQALWSLYYSHPIVVASGCQGQVFPEENNSESTLQRQNEDSSLMSGKY